MLRREPRAYAIVMSDMRMPEMSGAVFLREARRCAPTAVRMLLTGYSDYGAAAAAVNDGQIFRFLTKPCDRFELKRACAAALAQHRMQVAERELLEQTLHGAIQALTDVLALASPAAFGRSARLKELTGALARAAGAGRHVGDRGRLDARAPRRRDAAREHRREAPRRRVAEPDEVGMAARVPEVTERILANIPRLEGVREIVGAARPPLRLGRRCPRARGCCGSPSTSWRSRPRAPSAFLALETMRGRDGVYDPELLETFARTVGVRSHSLVVSEVQLAGLEVGMRLVHDVRGRDGRLLIARGHLVTAELLERLHNFPPGHVHEPLRVVAG